jgi:hypothetical protein
VKAITTLFALALLSISASAIVTVKTVPVGDAGNPNEPATASDTFSLYNTNMASNLNISAIAQSCSSGSCTDHQLFDRSVRDERSSSFRLT